MKKTLSILAILFLALSFSNCRWYTTYSPDGEGGVYRKGRIGLISGIRFLSFDNRTEHCKAEGKTLNCKKLKASL